MVVFMGLLNDLFPGVDMPRKCDAQFERVIEETTAEMKLTVDPDFTLRVVQLSELLAIRCVRARALRRRRPVAWRPRQCRRCWR